MNEIKAGASIPRRDLTGMRFGRWLVLRFASRDAGGRARWRCVCSCGAEKIVGGDNLTRGLSRSCGCLTRELTGQRSVTHGHAPSPSISKKVSPEYRSWISMKTRCYNPASNRFYRYGGRGIIVCDRWLYSFENFLADMGPRPKGTTLDRFPNKNGNYEPGNCRWATVKQQNRHQQYTKLDEQKAEQIRKRISAGASVRELAKEFSVSRSTIERVRSERTWA